MADTGWLDLTTFSSSNQGTGALAWSNPTNALTSNNADATATITAVANDVYTQLLIGVNVSGLSLPPLVWIRGIEVRYERAYSFTLSGVVVGSHAYLLKSSTKVGTNETDATSFTTGDTYVTVGSSTNLWGTTLTKEDVESATFGVGIGAVLFAPVSPGNCTAHIDHIQMKIYYEHKNEMFLAM